jgi:uncharacterized protein YkwD
VFTYGVRIIVVALAFVSLLSAAPTYAGTNHKVYLPAIVAAPLDPLTIGLNAINQERAAVGAAAVRLDARLNAAAQRFADNLAARNSLDPAHEGSDGSMPWDRAAQAGYDYTWLAENAALDFVPDYEAAVEVWHNSPGHYANMVDKTAKDIGLGHASIDTPEGVNHYFVLVLGAQ